VFGVGTQGAGSDAGGVAAAAHAFGFAPHRGDGAVEVPAAMAAVAKTRTRRLQQPPGLRVPAPAPFEDHTVAVHLTPAWTWDRCLHGPPPPRTRRHRHGEGALPSTVVPEWPQPTVRPYRGPSLKSSTRHSRPGLNVLSADECTGGTPARRRERCARTHGTRRRATRSHEPNRKGRNCVQSECRLERLSSVSPIWSGLRSAIW
jgi:hypothetical protein